MARYRQVVDPQTGKSTFVPIDDAARRQSGLAVHGDIPDFVSPIDGTIVRGRKGRDEHCRKHGVVPADEFSKEHYERAAKERERFFDKSKLTQKQKFARRQQLYNIIQHHIDKG